MTDRDAVRATTLERAHEVARRGPFGPTWESLQQQAIPEWYKDAKFGIFIHWLVSSVPAFANEWYARNMYVAGTPEFEHHRQTYGPQSEFGFKEFIPALTGSKFDAASWIDAVANSGARFIVPVAEHHDGFAFYDSSFTPWKATEMGPHRDVIRELSLAANERGIVLGVSNHRAENWWFFNGGTRFDSDVTDLANSELYGRAQPHGTQPDSAFLDDWLARLVQLVDDYEPAIVWFDWWIEEPAFEPYLREFAAYYYNSAAARGATAVINYKWEAFASGAAVLDVERGNVAGIQERYFQNDTSTSRVSWAYLPTNVFKSPADLVGELIDVVSKNGALLLNIGPRPDGSIPEEELEILSSIGSWLEVNGAAIYDTRAWLVFGEGPTEPALGSFVDGEATAWTKEDIRFTANGSTVFASFFLWPDSELTIQTFSTNLRLYEGEIAAVELLGFGDVTWRVDNKGLHVTLPDIRPNQISPVLSIRIAPPAPVERPVPDFPQ